jgi:hypothetical protein
MTDIWGNEKQTDASKIILTNNPIFVEFLN